MDESLINVWNKYSPIKQGNILSDIDKITCIKQNFSVFSDKEFSLLTKEETGEVILALAMSDRKFTEKNLEDLLNHNDHRISMLLVGDSKRYKLTEKMILQCIDFGMPEVLIDHGKGLSSNAISKIMKCQYGRAKQFIINHVPLPVYLQNKIAFNDHEVFQMLVEKDWYIPSQETYEKYLNYYNSLELKNIANNLIEKKSGLMEAEKLKKVIQTKIKKRNRTTSL